MEGVKIISLNPVHTDERGEIWDLVNGKVLKHISLLKTKKGHIRGNHYHKESKQYTYLLDGRMEVTVAHVHNPDKKETFALNKGDLIEIDPMISHALVALEDSILIKSDTSSVDEIYQGGVGKLKLR